MIFGDKFKVVQDIDHIYYKIGVGEYAPEYFWAFDNNGILDYCIMDDDFGQPSPANYSDTEYAKLMRLKACKILVDLLNQDVIEPIEEE